MSSYPREFPEPAEQGIVLLEEAEWHVASANTYPSSNFDRSPPQGRGNDSNGISPELPFEYQVMEHPAYTQHDMALPMKQRLSTCAETFKFQAGALRPGGPVDLFSKANIGFPLNWLITGFFNRSVVGLSTPMFKTYLGFEAHQAKSIYTLLNAAWYFKFMLGLVTDCVPIQRQRRKPYLYIGWTMSLVLMLLVAFMPEVDPYKQNGKVTNEDAPSQGYRYLIPLIIVSAARLLVNNVCEGMLVEYSHREGEAERGKAAYTMLAFRMVGEVLGDLFTFLFCNGPEYGGKFSFSLGLKWVFAIYSLVAFSGILTTHFFVQDERLMATGQRFGTHLRHIWRFLEQRATLHILIIAFLFGVNSNFSLISTDQITTNWLKMDGIWTTIANMLDSATYFVLALILSRWFLNTSWHSFVIVSVISVTALGLPVDLLTTFDVVRNPTLWMLKQHVSYPGRALLWILRFLLMIEVSRPGYEATTFGISSCVCNLAIVATKWLNVMAINTIDPKVTNIRQDTTDVRWHVARAFLWKYGIHIVLTLLCLPLLPKQKRQLRELIMRGSPNLFISVMVMLFFGGLFIAGITSNILAIIPSTQCLRFAGGNGCAPEKKNL